jgi:hypothetical protein
MSLNIAAGLGLRGNDSYPRPVPALWRLPDSFRVEDGHIVMPDIPGIGFEGNSDLIKVMREQAGRFCRRGPDGYRQSADRAIFLEGIMRQSP